MRVRSYQSSAKCRLPKILEAVNNEMLIRIRDVISDLIKKRHSCVF
jgi:hypothetical protein